MKIKKYFVGFVASTMLVSTCYCIKPVEAIDFSKDELNELWEKERLKKRQYQEKADDEYMESLRLKEIFQHKEDVAKLYEEKTVKK